MSALVASVGLSQAPQVGHIAFERLNFAVFFSFELLDSIRRSRLRTGLRR